MSFPKIQLLIFGHGTDGFTAFLKEIFSVFDLFFCLFVFGLFCLFFCFFVKNNNDGPFRLETCALVCRIDQVSLYGVAWLVGLLY